MLKVNEYFDGKVKSIGIKTEEGEATIGVMEKGNYEFGTSKKEIMKIITGRVSVKLPDSNDWKVISASESFIVEANKKFLINIEIDSSYICYYK